MQSVQSGSSDRAIGRPFSQPMLSDLFGCSARENWKGEKQSEEERRLRLRLMVNLTSLSVVLLLSLTLMLLVLPVILPPLPPPPPFLMLLPVVIFILLMLIAFVPSGFNAIVVSYVAYVDGVNKRSPATTGSQVGNADQNIFASNSESLQPSNFNEIC